ncbi:hypothetical protein LEP1GSC024_0852 [Leptospira noguchii str. 2001034031]|uniref:Uncharacterized protein n=1 Tax=Leptospira noguchii str. 2001034031 TaxID=1193053 RepID=M6YD98_9LEPT|nr:hypothetical protein LEP1GSC024_0852 [Leptospira noguchii str. 2001034031]
MSIEGIVSCVFSGNIEKLCPMSISLIIKLKKNQFIFS